MDIKSKLVSTATQYDMKQATKKGHNIYALAMYLQAIDDTCELVENGKTWEQALNECFNDRLLTHMLKVV